MYHNPVSAVRHAYKWFDWRMRTRNTRNRCRTPGGMATYGGFRTWLQFVLTVENLLRIWKMNNGCIMSLTTKTFVQGSTTLSDRTLFLARCEHRLHGKICKATFGKCNMRSRSCCLCCKVTPTILSWYYGTRRLENSSPANVLHELSFKQFPTTCTVLAVQFTNIQLYGQGCESVNVYNCKWV